MVSRNDVLLIRLSPRTQPPTRLSCYYLAAGSFVSSLATFVQQQLSFFGLDNSLSLLAEI